MEFTKISPPTMGDDKYKIAKFRPEKAKRKVLDDYLYLANRGLPIVSSIPAEIAGSKAKIETALREARRIRTVAVVAAVIGALGFIGVVAQLCVATFQLTDSVRKDISAEQIELGELKMKVAQLEGAHISIIGASSSADRNSSARRRNKETNADTDNGE